MTRKQVWLCVTAFLLVLASVLWGTLAMAASSSQARISPAAATINVTTTADTISCGIPCSLRGAIATADSGDTIIIPAGTYTLTLGSELSINKDLTLNGAGSGDTIIQAASTAGVADFRVFNITGGTVAISGVTIRHGKSTANGGGIQNSGTLTLTNSTVSGNITSNSGGGISNRIGTLIIINSSIVGNTSLSGDGGGINNSYGTVTLTSSTVGSNTANRFGGGIENGGGLISNGTLILTNSTVSDNTAGFGGGIRNSDTLTLTNSTVSDNTAGFGGGIVNGGTLTLTNSTVSGNTANYGGGINNNNGTSTITNSTISGNTAAITGGGIDNDRTLTITNSTVSGNTAPRGGGIFNSNNGPLTMTNSTVSGNTSGNLGGGIYVGSGALSLTNSTISGNTATGDGGGIYNGEGTVRPVNTIVAGNSAPTHPDCRGRVESLGHNLVRDATGCDFQASTGDQLGTAASPIAPQLGPLADNDGPTFTHALLPLSPAINAGDDTSCPETDQRGIPRPQSAHCDIGAFEFTGNIPPRAFNQTVTTTGDRPVTIVLTASDPETGDTLTFIIDSLPAGGDLFEGATITGDQITTGDRVLTGDTITYKARLGFAGTDSFGFKANDGTGDGNVATVTVVVNRPMVTGAVSLEGMPNPISGARITFSTGDQAIARMFSDPENGSFEIQLASGIYNVKAEKDGFLPATKMGVVINQDITLPEVLLLWGDTGDGRIDVSDLLIPAKNLGKVESPWP